MKKFMFLAFLLGLLFVAVSCTESKEYTIVFETNGGSEVADVVITSLEELSLDQVPTREGYTFVGWYLNEDLTNDADQLELTADSITVYAKWLINVYDVVLVYNNNEPELELEVNHGSLVEQLETPVYEGMVFEGWYSDSVMTVPFDFTAPIVAHTSIYAKWSV